jgi:DNA-dependent RNA polymerase auxiliary subunit epsilon
MVLEDANFDWALSDLSTYAEKKGYKNLKELAHKLYLNSEEAVKIAKEIEEKRHNVERLEHNLIYYSKTMVEDKIKEWKALLALAYSIHDIAPKLGIELDDAVLLYNGLMETSNEIENEIQDWYAKHEAFEKYGWEAHHITLKDISLFLVPLVIYILLERR